MGRHSGDRTTGRPATSCRRRLGPGSPDARHRTRHGLSAAWSRFPRRAPHSHIRRAAASRARRARSHRGPECGGGAATDGRGASPIGEALPGARRPSPLNSRSACQRFTCHGCLHPMPGTVTSTRQRITGFRHPRARPGISDADCVARRSLSVMPGEGPASMSYCVDQDEYVDAGPSPGMTFVRRRASLEAIVPGRALSGWVARPGHTWLL